MAVRQSYVGEMTNPIVEARLSIAMSGQSLAKRLGLSRQYVNRAEQGTYSKLNPSLIRWVSNVSNISPGAVEHRYTTFQKVKRQATINRIEPTQLARHNSKERGNVIFERWRSGFWPSSMAFATDFCLHPDTIQKYEEGITLTMPKHLMDALTESKLIDGEWVDETNWKPEELRSHTPF